MGFNRRNRLTALGYGARMRRVMARRVFLRPAAARASLNVNPAGTNNGITYTAWYAGTPGNSIRVAHVVPGTANAVLSVTISGNDLTVNVGTTAVAGTPASTAAQVVAAVNAAAGAPPGAKLLWATATEGDGSGVVAAQALTNLTGGA